MEMALSWKPGIVCMTGEGGNPLNVEVIRIFQIFTLHVWYWRAERARKNYQNKKKTTFGPPLLPIKPPHKTPPLTNLRGGGGPDPRSPLSIRAWTQLIRELSNSIKELCVQLESALINLQRSLIEWESSHIELESSPIQLKI